MGTVTTPWAGPARDALGGVGRALVLAMALLLATVGFGAGAVPRAHAEPAQLVRIELLQVTPDTLTADATLTIRGRVTNTSGAPMRYVSVSLWRDYYPVVSAADFAWKLDSPADVPEGYRMTNEDGGFVNLNDKGSPVFPAGASAEFALRAKVSDLHLVNPAPGHLYLLGVHVRAYPDDRGNQTVGRSRLLVPWQPSAPGSAVSARVAPLVLLTSAPALGLDGRFTDDHLAGELLGRLESLLTVAELPGATVVVDPSLIDELVAMSDGYTVGSVEVAADDTRALAAAAWMRRFDAVRQRNSVYRTPYGNPDLASAEVLGHSEAVDRARIAMPATHPLAGLPLAVWPAHGLTISRRTVDFLGPLAPALWIEPSGGQALHPLGRARLLRHNPAISSGGPGPAPSDSLPHRRTRLLSQLVIEERPLVLAVTTVAEAASVLGLPDWVRTVGLEQIPTSAGEASLSGPAPHRPNRTLWDRVEATQRRVMAWHDLRGTTDQAIVPAAQLGSRATNASMSESAALTYLTRATSSVPARVHANVTITMASSFVMGDRTTSLPLTLTNRSTHPVRVRVRMASDNPARIKIPDTPLITIDPGESVPVQFSPQAKTNGVVEFTAQIVTEGDRTVGESKRFSVNATNFGRIGWVIIISSGLVVLGGTAMRIKQVQLERTRGAASSVGARPSNPPRVDTSSRPHP